MSQFKYILPSGAEFLVNGPPGATQAQADRIFYEQVASGALTGYIPGQTLTSTASRLVKFELSRLDRGTAGVETIPILAISQGIPSVQGLSIGDSAATQSILAAIQDLPVPVGLPNLTNVPLTNPIDEGDIVLINEGDLPPISIGANGITALNEYQVQKILAQIAALVDQESDQISQDKGIGRFGFSALALEEAGYVKPGTSLRFFSVNPEDFVSVMSSPSVWTGKGGVYGLSDLLSDAGLQNRIQAQLMQQGYDNLLASGAISTVANPGISVSSGQVYTNSGLQSIGALATLSVLGTGLGSLDSVARNALSQSGNLNRLLSATNINLSTIGSGAVNTLTQSLSNPANLNLASIGTSLTNQITGGVGALVTNASKFGSQATALWAKAGNLSLDSIGTDLSKLAGSQLTGLTAGLTGSLNQITGQLTNLVPGSLSNLTSSLDVFGKAGSFATNFANPLGTLNNLGNLGNLGNINNLISGGGIGGAITGQLGSLTGALGNLGSLANIGAIGSLFGGGGDLVSGTAVAGGFNNTVNRATVDAAFARIVGSNKVPLPVFQYPSLAALAPRLDILQAQNFLKNLPGAGAGVFGQTVTI